MDKCLQNSNIGKYTTRFMKVFWNDLKNSDNFHECPDMSNILLLWLFPTYPDIFCIGPYLYHFHDYPDMFSNASLLTFYNISWHIYDIIFTISTIILPDVLQHILTSSV